MEEEQKNSMQEGQKASAPAEKNSDAQGMRQEAEPAYRPVVCPRCGSAHFEFITEYHKRIGLRVVSAFLLAVCIMLAVISFMDPDINIPPALIAVFLVCYLMFQIAVWTGESRTHVQGVCRDCGFIWLIG